MSTVLKQPRRLLILSLVACASLQMGACGWHLRGQVSLPFERVYVASDGFSLFAAELRQVIQSSRAVQLADTAEQAQVIVKVENEQRAQNILSLSTSGSVSEFLLSYQVSYRVMDNKGKDLVAPSQISLQRSMTYSDTETLGKQSEEKMLFRDMEADAVQQMLRRLSVVPIGP